MHYTRFAGNVISLADKDRNMEKNPEYTYFYLEFKLNIYTNKTKLMKSVE